MNIKVLVLEEKRIAAVYAHGQIEGLIIDSSEYRLGDIYLGKIHKKLPQIEALFVHLDDYKRQGFLHHPTPKNRDNKLGIGDKVMVQIAKEPSKTKGPSLKTDITLEGKYFYIDLVPQDLISLPNFQCNKNTYNKALELLLLPPTKLIRRKQLSRIDLPLFNALQDIYELLFAHRRMVHCFKKNPPLLISSTPLFSDVLLQRLRLENVNEFILESWLDAKELHLKLKKWILSKSKKTPRIKYISNRYSILEDYSLDLVIYDLLQPRVNIGEGAYILLERTEAITAIDVNSGPGKLSTNPDQITLQINCRAAKHIAKHLKLRNISGVIVIDFIDMRHQQDQLILLKCLLKAFSKDEERPQISQFSDLGLVEVTRRRRGQSLEDKVLATRSIFNEAVYLITPFVSSISRGHSYGLDHEFCYF